MASSRWGRAGWAVAALAVLALSAAALVAATSARADPWWAETTQAPAVTTPSGPPDALDRYLGTQQQPIVQTITVPAAAADTGFQIDWANIGIGVAAAVVAVLAVMSVVVVVRHGGHGGPGRPVMHG